MIEILAAAGGTAPDRFRSLGPAAFPSLSGRDAAARSLELGAALAAYGLDPGGRVAVVAPAGTDALVGLGAATACAAPALLIDPRCPDDRLRTILRDDRVSVALASDEKTLGRIVALRADLDALEVVLVFLPEEGERPSPALTVAAACATGARILEAEPPEPGGDARLPLDIVDRRGDRTRWDPADLAGAAGELAGTAGIGKGDVLLPYLPPSDPGWAPAVAAGAAKGASVIVGEPDGRLGEALADVRPSLVVATGTEWSSLAKRWRDDVEGRGWPRGAVARWGLARGASPETASWVRGIADRLVLSGVRSRGGGRLRRGFVVGASLSSEASALFRAVGLAIP